MFNSKCFIALIFSCFLFSHFALDSASADDTPELFITANRSPVQSERIGSSISSIDSEEIEARRQTTVLELLRAVPGLEVTQTGGAGRTASVFIRGAESDHTLVLIDGVRANVNSTGLFNFENLRAENIERIEVLRGPQSVLYGSEAIGGVINIVSKSAEPGTEASADIEAGSFGSHAYKASIRHGSENIWSSNSVSYLQTDGISTATGSRGNPEKDSFDNFSVSSSTKAVFFEDAEALVNLRYSAASTELDGFEFGVGPVDDLNFEQDNDTLVASVELSKPLTNWFTPRVQLGLSDDSLEGIDPDTEFNNYDIDNQTRSVTTSLGFNLAEAGLLTLGHVYQTQESENKGQFDESREASSFFLQDQFGIGEDVFLTGGLRFDDDSDFGEEVTYRVTLAWLVNQGNSRFHSSYGTGFKAPSMNELYFPSFGNPDLDAETSRGYDLGFEHDFGLLKLDLTFFHNEFEDLISADSVTFVAANIAEARALGVETAFELDFNESSRARFFYTWTDSEDKATGEILARRPRHRASLTFMTEPIDRLESALTVLGVTSRRESDRSEMDSYVRVDLSLAFEVNEKIKPYLRVDNLFDYDYEEVNGFGTSGIAAYAGLQASL